MKRLIIGLTLIVAMFIKIPTVSAAEINPTAGTYSYGSTSEFTGDVDVIVSNDLANTGDSQALLRTVGLGVIVVGIIAGTVLSTQIYRNRQTKRSK